MRIDLDVVLDCVVEVEAVVVAVFDFQLQLKDSIKMMHLALMRIL